MNLQKGGKVKLTKEADGTPLANLMVALGWDQKDGAVSGAEFDLDASLYMLGAGGKVRTEKDLIFYGHLKSEDGSIEHTGDNLTGAGEGDDESIKCKLNDIPSDVDKLVVVVTIYDAEKRSQNFGMVENAFVRLVDTDTNKEEVRFDPSFDASTATGVQFCTIFRKDGSWAFSADQMEFEGGLAALNTKYGIQ